MLNISKTEQVERLNLSNYDAGRSVLKRTHFKYFNRFLLGFAIVSLIVMFLPWTQNVTGNGYVTTLTPDQRPQTIQSPIAGRVEQWFVREGATVLRGDTIMRISEVKGEYLDPNLIENTNKQIAAKELSVASYGNKVVQLENQIVAINRERRLKKDQALNKLEQSQLKVIAEQANLRAAVTADSVAVSQLERQRLMVEVDGIESIASLEDYRQKAQEKSNKVISQRQKLLQAEQGVTIARLELNKIDREADAKIAKARSDQASALSTQLDTEAQVNKLEVNRNNYAIRNEFYYVRAPQDGFINKAIIGGIGETFKEGKPLVNIMPLNYDLAVETYVEPLDLPLMHKGEKVRVQFDGWPAIVFSGWPNATYGTYGGEVVAIERFITTEGPGTGKYRILLAPDATDHTWPKDLRPGSGAYTIALLEDVPVWYELWRRLNGFPANYYQPESSKKGGDDKKK
ncbi:MAG: HlyD family efflux transporter periplasmic adaptor subunit [Nonlabens sp.]